MTKKTKEQELKGEIKRWEKMNKNNPTFLNSSIPHNKRIAELKGRQEAKKEILKTIDGLENPYPKDVFLWDNQEQLKFNRGRFNRHCFEIVENTKEGIRKMIRNARVSY